MANISSAPVGRNASSPADRTTVGTLLNASHEGAAHHALRRLKSRLQGRFPSVQSSHLTEAIASGFGYNTNAALRAGLPGNSFVLAYEPFDAERLRQRLIAFGYPLREDFSTAPPPSLQPPSDYLEMLAELRRLQENPEHVGGRIERFRALCAARFAQAFGLGHPEVHDDKRVVQRWNVGADHGTCMPGWGTLTQFRMGGGIDFPGRDHGVNFFKDLPLTRTGKHCEYQTGYVSMPYSAREDLPRKLKEAALVAGRLGWTLSVHSEWSWYQAGQTELVLFRRTTSHEQMLQDWENSFSRWVVENRSRLASRANEDRRQVLEDITSCRHLPFDVRDYEDCRERYVEEYAHPLLEDSGAGMGFEFRRLMQKWQDSRNA